MTSWVEVKYPPYVGLTIASLKTGLHNAPQHWFSIKAWMIPSCKGPNKRQRVLSVHFAASSSFFVESAMKNPNLSGRNALTAKHSSPLLNNPSYPVSEVTLALLEKKFPGQFFLNAEEVAQIVRMSPESVSSALSRETFPIEPINRKGRYTLWSIIDVGVYIDLKTHAIINVPVKRRPGRPKSITSGV